ncbi:hypothetical protein DFJ73DRAFT_865475 [Zopfochytrium polystomum]|nr:hypothetical protein DFJ73DRAFT_865475 [Zopfochytrium polystomum]
MNHKNTSLSFFLKKPAFLPLSRPSLLTLFFFSSFLISIPFIFSCTASLIFLRFVSLVCVFVCFSSSRGTDTGD